MEYAEEFEVGKTYLLETESEDPSFEAFRTLTQNKIGLCITEEHPDNIKDKYDLDDSKFARLSTSSERTSIGPQELDLLGLTIKRFISEQEGVILLHGTDYLISKNDTSAVIRLIQSTQDRVREGSSIFLIVLNTSKIEEKEVQKLKDELDLEIKSLKDTTEKERETPVTGHEEHLVSQVRSMMEFLEEQEDYIDREEKRIDQETPSGASEFMELEELKEEVETLREENRALKNELERIKTEKEEEGEEDVFEEEIVDEVVATVEEEKKDIEEQMEQIEHEKEKGSQRPKRHPALMGTLRKLEEEVRSLRDDVKTIKKGSSKEAPQEMSKEDESREEGEIKTDIIDSEISSAEPAEDDQEATDKIDSERVSDAYSEEGHEVIREPRLEDEYITEEKERSEADEKEPMEESKEEEIDDRILQEENKTILRSNSTIAEDIESENSIEVQKGVTLRGSLKSKKNIALDDDTTIQGDVVSESGDVDIGKDCKITGEISGNSISISERSKVKDVSAKEDVVLKNNTRVKNILSQKDVKIFENVEIDGGIDYGGQLDLNGEYINIRGRIRPIDEDAEVVKEKWV